MTKEGASDRRRPRSVACGQTKEGASDRRRPRSVACGDRPSQGGRSSRGVPRRCSPTRRGGCFARGHVRLIRNVALARQRGFAPPPRVGQVFDLPLYTQGTSVRGHKFADHAASRRSLSTIRGRTLPPPAAWQVEDLPYGDGGNPSGAKPRREGQPAFKQGSAGPRASAASREWAGTACQPHAERAPAVGLTGPVSLGMRSLSESDVTASDGNPRCRAEPSHDNAGSLRFRA